VTLALADVDEERALVDVERLEAGEPQRRRPCHRLARTHAAERLRDGGNVLGRRAAAAARDVDPAGLRPFADLARH